MGRLLKIELIFRQVRGDYTRYFRLTASAMICRLGNS